MYGQMTAEEIGTRIAQIEAQISAEWKAWKKCSKEALLGEVSRQHRMHCMTIKDSKNDLLAAIVTAKFGGRLDGLNKQLARLSSGGRERTQS